MPQTGWLMNKRDVFLRVLEAEMSKIKEPADSVSPESCFLVRRQRLLVVSSGGRRGRGILTVFFSKHANRIHEGSTFTT